VWAWLVWGVGMARAGAWLVGVWAWLVWGVGMARAGAWLVGVWAWLVNGLCGGCRCLGVRVCRWVCGCGGV
jgi:hypothetical protein